MLKVAIFRNSYNLSDADASKSASLSLITSDVNAVSTSLGILFDVLVSTTEIILCSCFLWTALGPGIVLLLSFCAGIVVLGFVILQSSGSYSQDAIAKTTARKLSTKDMMGGMKDIRLTSNVAAISHSVTKSRNDELAAVDLFGWGWSIPTCMGMFVAHSSTSYYTLTLNSCNGIRTNARYTLLHTIGIG